MGQCDNLAAALRPFAEAANTLDRDVPQPMRCEDEYPAGDALWTHEQPTVGDLRAAARALSEYEAAAAAPSNYGELVRRLRDNAHWTGNLSGLIEKAADAIEQQARDLAAAQSTRNRALDEIITYQAEIVGLTNDLATALEGSLRNSGNMRKFNKGDHVEKIGGDYTFDGIVINDFQKRSGKWRYVVEDDRGLLLIHSESNLQFWQLRGTDTPEHEGTSG